MTERDIIQLAQDALGDGFLFCNDPTGWAHFCPECGEYRHAKPAIRMRHKPECRIGRAVLVIDTYLYDLDEEQ